MVASRLIRFILLFGIATSCAVYAAEQFIAKKAPKAPSSSALKETCCQQLADGIKQVPNLLAQIALFQDKAITIVEGYWQSDKESFCQQASKEKLSSCSAQLKQLNEKTAEIIAQYKKVLSELAA